MIYRTSKQIKGGVRDQQAMISNLTEATCYTAYYIESTNAISPPIQINTKKSDNCRLVYNLGFCDQVAYSVPANPTDTVESIQSRYDNHAQELFQPFETAILQYNCDSTKYSLVRNYKTEPSNAGQVALRYIDTNHSRSPWIDETLSPGCLY
ncbi:hypothetical protein INT45_001408 [Circinella minor]|uniref:Uncharacterized protein n=1 Tax=Circinella minor TaxID=1195481 RepID=A0A8H7RQM2_9FUNG|nr:hypothetical protein INT45_001408 [Circinella minor]